jgi:NAD(P)-dependent dehydrogenase (short-subunit alcohol dehydrogenase family)
MGVVTSDGAGLREGTGLREGPGLRDRVVLITGATGGLGQEVALALAPLGPRLYLAARDRARASATLERIAATAPGTDVHVLLADLSTRDGVASVADAFLATGDPLHVLLNNVGGVSGLRRQVSADGVELTFALNHLAPFALTLRLMGRLRESRPARVVNVASDAYKDAKGRFDFGDYNAEHKYRLIRQYGHAKLATVLFTRELARRLAGTGVTANAVTPPRLTATRFAHNVHPLAKVALTLARPFTMPVTKGAAGLVHLCASPDVDGRNGEYWSGMRQPPLTAAARNDEDARRLWELSEDLTGVRW